MNTKLPNLGLLLAQFTPSRASLMTVGKWSDSLRRYHTALNSKFDYLPMSITCKKECRFIWFDCLPVYSSYQNTQIKAAIKHKFY
jgi:hypothetical protein